MINNIFFKHRLPIKGNLIKNCLFGKPYSQGVFRAKTAGGPPAVLGRLLSVQKQSPQDCGAISISFPLIQAV